MGASGQCFSRTFWQYLSFSQNVTISWPGHTLDAARAKPPIPLKRSICLILFSNQPVAFLFSYPNCSDMSHNVTDPHIHRAVCDVGTQSAGFVGVAVSLAVWAIRLLVLGGFPAPKAIYFLAASSAHVTPPLYYARPKQVCT